MHFVILLALLPTNPSPTDSTPREWTETDGRSDFEGRWELVAVRCGGEDLPPEHFHEHYWLFRGDRLTLSDGDQDAARGTYLLNPFKNPPQIDFTDAEGGWSFEGVYRAGGDRTEIVLDEPGLRPHGFWSEKGSSPILVTLRRVRK